MSCYPGNSRSRYVYRIHQPASRSRSTEKYLAANASGPAFKEVTPSTARSCATSQHPDGDYDQNCDQRFDILSQLVDAGLGHVTERILLLLRVRDLLSALLVSR